MTKIDIFSGFLGAGKTTLIKKLIQEAYAGEKLVLIENEFGEIGIDGGFMKEAGIEVNEMNSGCICCSLVGDFAVALQKVIDEYNPDRILIEPSGVGKLSDVITAVQNADTKGAVLNSFTTVADAGKCKLYSKNFGEFYNNQIENASTIILSRTGNIKPDKLDTAIAIIKGMNPNATVITTPWEELEGKQIVAAMEKTASLQAEIAKMEAEMHHHHHDEHCECGCHDHHHHDHHHDEHCECGCHDHHHDEHCECGCHDHDHHHHDEHCECGCHHHDHHHHHDEHCECGCHDHDHHHHDEHCECGCHDHHHHDEHCECGCHDHHHDEHCECGCHDHHHHDEHCECGCHEHHHDEHCECGCHDHEHHHHDEHCECGCHDHHHHDEHCECGCHDHHHHHHADEIFTSWGKETHRKFSTGEIEGILNALESEEYGIVLRAKGIVATEEGKWIHFDYVPGEQNVRFGAADVTGRICVIGSKLNEDAIAALFGVK